MVSIIGKLLALVTTSMPFRSGCALDAAMHVGYSTARLVEHTQNLHFGQVYPESFLKILDPFPFDYIVQHLAGGTPARTQSPKSSNGQWTEVQEFFPGPTEAPV